MKTAQRMLAFLLLTAMALVITGCSKDGGGTSLAYPNYSSYESAANPSPGIMRDMTSMEITADMTLGWNLVNTLDVCAADRDGDGQVNEAPAAGEAVDETLWGNIYATQELFDTLKASGVNAVRIPVTWRDHMGAAPDYTIDELWMDRVQQVVDYAYSIGMYVILNLHHDGGGDPKFGAWIRDAQSDYDGTLARYKAVWTQIADRFKDYSDYLIFESMNEVGFDDVNESDAYVLLNKLNQEFVNLIRASGGNNAKRHLLIAGYWTDIAMTSNVQYRMPNDPENRCILSLHYYTPWEFCTTDIQYTWGTDAEVDVLYEKMGIVKASFIDKGIPVIMGEFGTGETNDLASRIFFFEYVTKLCKDMGVPAFIWSNTALNRNTLEWQYDGLLEALLRAASGEDYTVEK